MSRACVAVSMLARGGAGAWLCPVIVAGIAALAPAPGTGQEIAPARSLPGVMNGGCPRLAVATSAPAPDDALRARSLLRDGREAALFGDREAALARFDEAAALDPTDPEIAYSLARVHEESGAATAAVRELCRYLVLAPGGADAAEVRERLAALTGPVEAIPAAAAERFHAGVALLEQGRPEQAEVAFSAVLHESADLAEAHLNRGVARLELGRTRQAASDLRRYLELDPEGPAAETVRARLASLRLSPSPGGVLARGVLVPGLGQFATGRPGRGALVFGAAGAATWMALRTGAETRTVTHRDPFGNEYQENVRVRTQPHRDVGLAAAVAVTLAGAAEAYAHARRAEAAPPAPTRASSRRIAPIVEPGVAGSLSLGLRVTHR